MMLESSGDKAPPDVVTDIFAHLDGIKQSSMMESVRKKSHDTLLHAPRREPCDE